MIGNAEVVAAGLEEIDPLKGTETFIDNTVAPVNNESIRRDRSPEGDGNL